LLSVLAISAGDTTNVELGRGERRTGYEEFGGSSMVSLERAIPCYPSPCKVAILVTKIINLLWGWSPKGHSVKKYSGA
jgi:hypothetical protein